jgi:hypothetical protein
VSGGLKRVEYGSGREAQEDTETGHGQLRQKKKRKPVWTYASILSATQLPISLSL